MQKRKEENNEKYTENNAYN